MLVGESVGVIKGVIVSVNLGVGVLVAVRVTVAFFLSDSWVISKSVCEKPDRTSNLRERRGHFYKKFYSGL